MPPHLRLITGRCDAVLAPVKVPTPAAAPRGLDAYVEQALTGMAARGPRAAGDLFDLVSRPVYGLALAITGDEATAQEVAVEAFTEIWVTCGDRPDGAGTAWVMDVVCRSARSRLPRAGQPHRMDRLRLVPSI